MNLSIDYSRELVVIKEFIEKCPTSATDPTPKYNSKLQGIADRSLDSITIDLDDLKNLDLDPLLYSHILQNTLRYVELFSVAIDELLPPSSPVGFEEDVLDVIMAQRRQRDEALPEDSNIPPFPASLIRRYSVYFKPPSSQKIQSVRQLKSSQIGSLVNLKGIVTRVSEVKPLLAVVAYSCDKCGCETFQEITQKQFTPISECTSEDCKKKGSKGKLNMLTRASKFYRYQEARIQELTEQVPVGHIPRSMKVLLYENMTRQMNPGDVVCLGGIYLATPYTGFRGVRAGLLAETHLAVHQIENQKKHYHELQMTPEIEQKIQQLARDQSLYDRLAQSIAPEIYGHEDVKKALLLLLVGGVTKEVQDGMKIRGDINMCLMGDPGVAKSQLLKYISKVAPRGVYTTGRGSSGVGLTAAVMKDPVTDEMVLEGGALVLADNGICCIDEFDKMDENDRTSIHEVMEQQTISISKAGITTTLNARTSILAAANPHYGRYNPSRSPTENINLPAALLSRFDLLFLILDKANLDDDARLAQHVTFVHQHGHHPTLGFEPVDATLMRHYIALARTKRPIVPPQVANHVVNEYVHLRKQEHNLKKQEKANCFTYTTARSLLGILRMAQALARLRFSEVVEVDDITEALRLMDVSKASLVEKTGNFNNMPISARIYEIIRERAKSTEDEDELVPELDYNTILDLVLHKGYTEPQLLECIQEYEELNVWQLNSRKTKLMFVSG